ncbi:MAG: Rab family GTPase [Rhodothermales bacterium]
MGTLQKKICMLGTFAVGKTSLVSRFVQGIFSEKYLTTIGVKIDKKCVQLDDQHIELLLWDLNGEDRFQTLSMSYLRGSAGYILVADGTRRTTLDAALALHERAREALGKVPFMLVLNKADLVDEWELKEDDWTYLERHGWTVFVTSAKTGTRVDEAFHALAHHFVDS